MVRMFFSASPFRLGSMKTWLSETHQTKKPKFFVPIESCRVWREEAVKMEDGKMFFFPPKGLRWNTSRCLQKVPQAKHRPVTHPFWGVQNVKTNQSSRNSLEASNFCKISLPWHKGKWWVDSVGLKAHLLPPKKRYPTNSDSPLK